MANPKVRSRPKMDCDRLLEEVEKQKAIVAGIFESVPGALIVLDHELRLVDLNDEARKLFGGGSASLIGRSLEDACPKSLAHILGPGFIKRLLEEKDKTSTRYSNTLHKWFKVSVHASDFGISVRLEDVTIEMAGTRLLRLNEASVARVKDFVFWVKHGGHVIYANQSMCDALDYNHEEIAKLKIFDIDPSLADRWTQFFGDVKKISSAIYETSFLAKDGSGIPVEVTYNYLEYGEEYLIAFARDITARKKAENALKEAKAEAELYVDLMGHDINNMNQVATGYLELALDKMRTEGMIDNTQIDLIAKPHEMLLNSSRLIENVRKVQMERAGHYESRIMDVGKILQEVQSSYAHVADRDIRVELDQDGECRVRANELVKDIFMNLIGNSIKHSTGPLVISIEMAKIEADGRAYCRVAVEDSGPGIPDGMKAKLLYRLDLKNARARGKGFGMYLIKQLVDDFNGKFWIEDRVPGDHTKGARFVVMLPAME